MQKRENQLLAASVLLVVLSSALFFVATEVEWRGLSVLTGMLGLSCLVAALFCLDIRKNSPANSYPIRLLLKRYGLLLLTRTLGNYKLWRYNRDARNCKKIQDDLLLLILDKNSSSEYGQKYGFGKITSPEEFVKRVPLATYAHFDNYLERMRNGEENVLTSDKVVFYALSSGTSGKNKTIPVTDTYRQWSMAKHAYLLAVFKHTGTLKRTVSLVLYPPDRHAPCGTPMSSITVYLFPPQETNVVPVCITKVYQEFPAYYIQALFLLRERELGNLSSFSTNIAYYFFKFIEEHWRPLCDDIEQGQIREDLELPGDGIRKEFSSHFQADPRRAEELRREFSVGFVGISRRVWPSLKVAYLNTTGGFAHPAKLLRENYMKGVKLVSSAYVCSEGSLAFALEENVSRFTFTPYDCFVEFIPVENVEEDQPETLFADQLQTGASYELVLTNTRGLYRYRLGDIVKVTGFHYQLPTFDFRYRLGQELNVTFEHTPESIMYECVEESIRHWSPNIALVDYTACEALVIESVTGRKLKRNCYIIFLELSSEDFVLTDAQTEQLDAMLCQRHQPYKACRDKGSVHSMVIVQVRSETFEELRHRLMGQYQNQQFKMPRVIRNSQHVQFLLNQSRFDTTYI